MRIAFTHNLKTADEEEQAEFDSVDTVRLLSETLRSLGHEVHPVDVSGPISRLVARLETLRPDLVFNTAQGSHGRFREAFYPALFEQLRLPYTGSGAHVCSVTLDKQATKLLVQRAAVPTPRWVFFDLDRPIGARPLGLRYPVIVKPNFEGRSKGISQRSMVHTERDLRVLVEETLETYGAGVLVEEFVVGRDVTVPWLETMGVLSPAAYRLDVEGVAPGHEIYDYTLKNDHPERVQVEVPALLPATVMERIRGYAGAVVHELDLRDMGRVDFRVTDEGEIFFIEVNALPSLEPGSSLYEGARLRGLETEADVLAAILDSAIRRQHVSAREVPGPETLRVGLAYNVRRVDPRGGHDEEAEFDSPATIQAITRAIEGLGHSVIPLEATPELPRVLGDVDVDLVFNIAEGIRGRSREAQIPALLDLLGIPFTGSDAAALAVTLDKGLAKRLVREAGIATARWAVVSGGQPVTERLRYPLIVKPNAEGSSKGITGASVARDPAALERAMKALFERYQGTVLIEEFLVGREFTVGILGDEEPTTLPIMEVCFAPDAGELPIYTYEHKTTEDLGVSFQVPADIDDELAERIRGVALDSFAALGCRDVGRVDIRLDADGVPHFIECNPLPGLSPGFSDLCVAAEATGMDHAALVAAILAPAVRRMALEREGA